MPLTGHLWPKLECCTTSFPIWGPILDKAGFLVKCGLIWLNMRNLHNTPHISRLKTVSWKVFLFFKRAIPISNFVGYHPSIIFYIFGVVEGTYPPGWTVLSIHEVIWLCHSMDIWDPNWTVVKAFSDIRTKFWIYIAGFVLQCGLISLNMGITVALFDWTLAIYPTPLIFRNSK